MLDWVWRSCCVATPLAMVAGIPTSTRRIWTPAPPSPAVAAAVAAAASSSSAATSASSSSQSAAASSAAATSSSTVAAVAASSSGGADAGVLEQPYDQFCAGQGSVGPVGGGGQSACAGQLAQ